MINALGEVFNDKTIDQYKVIEEKYSVLKAYLKNIMEYKILITKDDIELILKSLDREELKTTTKLYAPNGEVISEEEENE